MAAIPARGCAIRGVWQRRGSGGLYLVEAQRGRRAVVGEFELDIISLRPRDSSMLDRNEELPVSPAQVQIGIVRGVQLGASAQGLNAERVGNLNAEAIAGRVVLQCCRGTPDNA